MTASLRYPIFLKGMMWKALLIVIFICSNLLFASARTSIGHIQISFTDSSRQNRIIPAEIYYPADTAGDNVPLSISSTAKFPLIVFGHGFLMSWDSYAYLWEALVPEGYILVFPKTEAGIAPQHLEFGRDLAFLFGAMENLGSDSSSIFFNRLDSTNCVMGHSMGGGASLLAVQFDSTISAIVNLAAAETNPSAIAASAQITIPSLIIAGGNDCVTPPSTNQIPVFDSLLSQCKYFIEIIGGSHCQMADDNLYCNIGEASCSPAPAITRTVQHEIILRYLLPWLDRQLRLNCSSQNLLDSLMINDPEIIYSKNCSSCQITTSISVLPESNDMNVYPNPFEDFILVKNYTGIPEDINYQFLNSLGQLMQEGGISSASGSSLIQTAGLQSGLYFLKLKNIKNIKTIKLLKYHN